MPIDTADFVANHNVLLLLVNDSRLAAQHATELCCCHPFQHNVQHAIKCHTMLLHTCPTNYDRSCMEDAKHINCCLHAMASLHELHAHHTVIADVFSVQVVVNELLRISRPNAAVYILYLHSVSKNNRHTNCVGQNMHRCTTAKADLAPLEMQQPPQAQLSINTVPREQLSGSRYAAPR